jgi:hypothetical protein
MPVKRVIRGVTKRPPEGQTEVPEHILAVTPCAKGPVEGYYHVWPAAFEAVVKQFNGRWKTAQSWSDRDGYRHEIITNDTSDIMAYCAIPKGGLDYENGTYTIRQEIWEKITRLDF